MASDNSEIAIVGRSCRLPGAPDLSSLWALLSEARCAVSKIPEDRWAHARLFHPRRFEPGKSYTWSAGVLDDIWGFDPGVFGISPREATQMDPQQRLLLELVWEALEDAGIPPSKLAGKEVGVFVGASALDYGNRGLFDLAAGDAHFATGNTLSLISNRISYIFDFRGPSLTIDTACSSSLVALHEAVAAIESGRIDTAVVAGVNILASPIGFITFSQAGMLSPTGLCRAFDAKADGYVRAEGGVALVLQSVRAAAAQNNEIFGVVVGSGVNSDGRTVGVSMPSSGAQADLLRRVYGRAGIKPDSVAFIEAHGTGTRVGDPAEAMAIGEVLGQLRARPIPIGSIKTNIGHLEPAAGLAGMLKALLALQHDFLPASLHFEESNPEIDFDQMNLRVCSDGLSLIHTNERRYAGVNSFGFGGTNAHVIVSDAPQIPTVKDRDDQDEPFLFISAQSREALAALASEYASRMELASEASAKPILRAAGHRREHLSERLAIPWRSGAHLAATLRAFGAGETSHPDFVRGTTVGRKAATAFVYSGNGSQWPGMGRSAYLENETLRQSFDEADQRYEKYGGWSLKAAIFDDAVEQRLKLTSVAQPLIFAIQYAATEALRDLGLKPTVVLGHSVGEVAAAQAAGILDLDDALKVIHFRSHHQERTRNRGRMTVLISGLPDAERLVRGISGLDIAAFNSPRAFTISGSNDAITKVVEAAKQDGITLRGLDLDYPFHSHLMNDLERPLLRDLTGLLPKSGAVPLVSTVSGSIIAGRELDASYWWRNLREPVQFAEAIRQTAAQGARIFVEIGPRATLLSHMSNTLAELSLPVAVMGVLENAVEDGDPIRRAAANGWVRGSEVDISAVVGRKPPGHIRLPNYPWQRKQFRIERTLEALSVVSSERPHPLIGSRATGDGIEWRGHLDPELLPQLSDHRVNGQLLLPGAAFIEMALAAAREWFSCDAAAVSDLDLFQPMIFAGSVSRETLVRVSPGTDTVEILSRQRLSQVPWQLHAIGKISRHVPPVERPAISGGMVSETVTTKQIYSLAAAAGLEFGPSFRQLRSVERFLPSTIVVTLTEPPNASAFGLDPARLDSCFHGLIVLFAGLHTRRQAAYVPVHFGDVRLFKPGIAPVRSIIEIQHCDARSILADFTLLDEDDQVIAIMRDARFRPLRAGRERSLASCALVQRTSLATAPYHDAVAPLPIAAVVKRIQDLTSLILSSDGNVDGALLFEGWATACAMALLSTLVDSQGRLDVGQMVATGRLSDSAGLWLSSLLSWLEVRELAFPAGSTWQMVANSDLPKPEAILRTLATEHPERSWELLLASRLTRLVERSPSSAIALAAGILPRPLLDMYELRGVWSAEVAKFFGKLLQDLVPLLSKGRAIRILQVGFDTLSHTLARLAQTHDACLTILELDQQRREQASLSLEYFGVEICDQCLSSADAPVDLVISAGSLHRWPSTRTLISELAKSLAPGGLMVAAEPLPSLFRDLVFGTDPDRFASELLPGFALGRLQTIEGWKHLCASAELADATVEALRIGSETATIVIAQQSSETVASVREQQTILIRTCSNGEDVAGELKSLLDADEYQILVQQDSDEASQPVIEMSPRLIVYFGDATKFGISPADALRDRCMRLKALVEDLGGLETSLWIVTHGALPDELGYTNPVETGYWAFARTVANEFPNLHVRRVDLSSALSAKHAATRIKDLILCEGNETEFHLTSEATRVVRIERLPQARHDADRLFVPARLERGSSGNLDGLSWSAVERSEPGPGQIEVKVEATGLNFRDVMWSLSMLPDEILEDGFAGPCLGLECAGRVLRVGPGVEDRKPGERVIALARWAFATHLIVPSWAAVPAPSNMSAEAAATVPVAFATAYYALVTLARIEREEWILIHGGAGGVGLAALQIARWRGARVVATAGSEAKRDFLRMMGADHVLDSRTLNFADEVRQIAPEGMDVVLNSLSGEAMERGIKALRPFGRFLELGKRDYVANTYVGLRPFRRNLTYYGIDLDQLLLEKSDLGAKIFQKCAKLFEAGVFSPLPYCCFSAVEVVDAFRLMQHSGHIGKIIVAPPVDKLSIVERSAEKDFVVDLAKTHLVTGAFSGFGLETTRWLAKRGARHIVMLGRRGSATPEATALLSELDQMSVVVRAEACDVADFDTLARVFKKISSELPPLAGVVHAAMVLEDAVIGNLTAEQMETVLRPKVLGAENLDALTRDLELDYFVLFSSATTLIGNPGQGAYVAANAYMEGLARRRRQQGLPAHAIAWGAIGDAGVLAQNRDLQQALASRIGIKAMTAQEALDLMANVLSEPIVGPDDAVVAIAPVDWGTARARLPGLSSPTYAALGRGQRGLEAAETAPIDIRALVQSDGIESARMVVLELIVDEVSRVLRMPKEDVSLVKPLSEVGLDSLMAVELAMSLQGRIGGEMLSASASGLTVADLGQQILALVGRERAAEQVTERRHDKKGLEAPELRGVTEKMDRQKVAAEQ